MCTATEMYRRIKFMLLAALAYANIAMGMVDGSIGATLGFLQHLFSASLDHISRLFIAYGIGVFIASISFSTTLKKCDAVLLMGICSLVCAVGIAVFDVLPSLLAGFFIILVYGVSSGLLHCGVYHVGNVLFPDEAYVFHILAGSYSTGTFLGPLVIETILGETNQVSNTNFNISKDIGRNLAVNQTDLTEKDALTVNYIYLVLGLFFIPLVPALIIMFTKAPLDGYSPLHKRKYVSNNERGKSKKWQAVFICFSIALFTLSGGSSYTYGSYLTLVTSEGSLQMTLQDGVLMTTGFWFCLLLGRLAAIGLSLLISQTVLMYVCVVGCTLDLSLVLWTYGSQQQLFFWIQSMALGLFQGPTFAATLEWSRKYVTLSPRAITMYMLISSSGLSLLMYTSGVIIGFYGENAFLYLQLAFGIAQLIAFSWIHFIVSWKLSAE